MTDQYYILGLGDIIPAPEKRILFHLVLKKQWFDKIKSGQKKEEYRAISPHWQRVLSDKIKIKGRFYHSTDVVICFCLGYGRNWEKMYVQCTGLRVGTPNPEWI